MSRNKKTTSTSTLSKLFTVTAAAVVASAAGVAAAVFSDPNKRKAVEKATGKLKNQALKSVSATVAKAKKSTKK